MKKVIITPNPYRDRNFDKLRRTMEVLRSVGVEVCACLPFELDKKYTLPDDIHFSKLDREIRTADMLVCLGGDGTILHMAKTATRYNVPILGINIGTLGFMAELEDSELDALKRIAADDYVLDERKMLNVTVYRDRDIIFREVCLNDAVFTKGAVARVVSLLVRCDGVQVMECNGDGVIVATPTGSTAYSLSAGGPIVEPGAESILITPICAHDVSTRSVVVSDKREITVSLSDNTRHSAYLSVDGGKALKMNAGDVARIERSESVTKLVRLKDHSFYDVVNMKFKKN